MSKLTALTVLPLALVGALLAAHCTAGGNDWAAAGLGGGGGDGGGGGGDDSYQVPPACDPDGFAPCPEDTFVCVDEGATGKRCEGQQPAVPDAGGWDCEVLGTTMICYGDHVPGDAGDWVCDERAPGEIVCRRHAYVPSGGEGGTWDCYYSGDLLVCDWTAGEEPAGPEDEADGDDEDAGGPPGVTDCPPGVERPTEEVCGDGVDNDCDGWTDEFCTSDEGFDPFEGVPDGEPYDPFDDHDGPGTSDGPPPDGCVCVPGARRYCDTPTYCDWGIQTCAATGMRWRRCTETTPPAECRGIASWYSPEAEECCIRAGHCCQDMWDLDFDGDTWESLGDCVDISCG